MRPRRTHRARATTPGSQARTAAPTASRSAFNSVIARDPGHGAERCGRGMPNGSRSPCTTSVGTVTSSSSWRRLGAGVPARRRGGCSGNARQRTPTAPSAPAVRQATRAPRDRPPATSGSPSSSPARRCWTTADHAASSWPADGASGARQRGTAARRARRSGPRRSRRPPRSQVRRRHASAGAVAEDQRSARSLHELQMGLRSAVRSVDLENHPQRCALTDAARRLAYRGRPWV